MKYVIPAGLENYPYYFQEVSGQIKGALIWGSSLENISHKDLIINSLKALISYIERHFADSITIRVSWQWFTSLYSLR